MKKIITTIAIAFCLNANAQIITTIAGNGFTAYYGDGGQATNAKLNYPSAVAVDATGNVFITDNSNNVIRKINTAGVISTYAGIGNAGFSGDGGQATAAKLSNPQGIKFDAAGNLYIADFGNAKVRMINTAGIITTVAGSYGGYSGDGGQATDAYLNGPNSVSFDASGNMYISDQNNAVIRKVNTLGIISTVAGNNSIGAGYSGDGGQATDAQLFYSRGIALDASGNLYISEEDNVVRLVNTAGIISTFAGQANSSGYSGDGGQATNAQLTQPFPVVIDAAGNVYISDNSSQTIRMVNTAGIISTFAGQANNSGYSGDGGQASAAQFYYQQGIAIDATGNFYVADAGNNVVRKIDLTGIITTIGGIKGVGGDNGPATAANLSQPTAMAFDAMGNMLIADRDNNLIRKISTTGIITTFAGTGVGGAGGNGGQATDAQLNGPTGIAVDAAGNVYCSLFYGSSVRVINTSGVINLLGSGGYGYYGDGGPVANASFRYPTGLAFDAAGNLYIADSQDALVRKVNTNGIISTVAGDTTNLINNPYGTPNQGYSGDGGAATAAMLNSPVAVAVDAAGNIFIADQNNQVIRMVNTAGIISTFAGQPGSSGFSGDGGPATAAMLGNPSGLAFDNMGNLYVTELTNNRIRMINTVGIISTVVGDGSYSFGGDGGLAIAAKMAYPKGLAFDAANNLYIADANNNRIRFVSEALVGGAVSSYTNICVGQTATLTASNPTPGVTYAWSPSTGLSDTISANTLANPSSPTLYTVTTTNTFTAFGVSQFSQETDTTSVYVNALPMVNVNSDMICAGQQFTITPSGATTYTYSSGSAIVTPTVDATYTVTGAGANGCKNTAISSVTVSAMPSISSQSGNILVCDSTSASFAVHSAGTNTYQWYWLDLSDTTNSYTNQGQYYEFNYNTDSMTIAPIVNNTDYWGPSGTYAVYCLITNPANTNCFVKSKRDTMFINTLPTVSATSNILTLCAGNTATLTASGASTYTWSTIQTGTSIAVTPTLNATYTVTGTDVNGCKNKTTLTQTVSNCGIGIEQYSNGVNVSIYPNPSEGVFNIVLDVDAQLIVTNALGEVVLTKTVNAGIETIDVQNQVAGVYFVRVIQHNNQQTIKLIKN